ncbi:MAG: dihydropteroate synthase [Nitrospirota bacterium]
MILIAESINIMSKTIGPAIREKNPKPIQELAVKQIEGGANILDLNLGPARKEGDAMMEWLVKTVQEVTDVPLSLDTTNPIAIEAGLKVAKQRALINSISAQKERLEITLPLAKKYDVPFIAVLLSDAGLPRDVEGRISLFFEILTAAQGLGISEDDIWVDPVIFPVSADQNQVVAAAEFLKILPDLTGTQLKSACGLSNVSNGSPAELRGILNQTYLALLMTNGLTSAIVDTLDKELVQVARGLEKSPDLDKWIASLSPEKQVEFSKTMKILKNEVLYCHSWLEL